MGSALRVTATPHLFFLGVSGKVRHLRAPVAFLCITVCNVELSAFLMHPAWRIACASPSPSRGRSSVRSAFGVPWLENGSFVLWFPVLGAVLSLESQLPYTGCL